ncbi:hypothetical protein AAEX28_03995 [Lentisphaerota bacterium WC36G]|nr:hypothetical protein LJT99_06870 [Lentisphaerae bacterium WC36]
MEKVKIMIEVSKETHLEMKKIAKTECRFLSAIYDSSARDFVKKFNRNVARMKQATN